MWHGRSYVISNGRPDGIRFFHSDTLTSFNTEKPFVSVRNVCGAQQRRIFSHTALHHSGLGRNLTFQRMSVIVEKTEKSRILAARNTGNISSGDEWYNVRHRTLYCQPAFYTLADGCFQVFHTLFFNIYIHTNPFNASFFTYLYISLLPFPVPDDIRKNGA